MMFSDHHRSALGGNTTRFVIVMITIEAEASIDEKDVAFGIRVCVLLQTFGGIY